MYVERRRGKKTSCSSVNRLKLERERRAKQGAKDYARARTLFLTGDAHTKNKERSLCARLAFTFFSLLFYPSHRLCLYVDVWIKKIHRKSKKKKKKKKKKKRWKMFFFFFARMGKYHQIWTIIQNSMLKFI